MRSLLYSATLLAALTACQQSENAQEPTAAPYEFKGMALGSPSAEAHARGNYICEAVSDNPMADQACKLFGQSGETIAGAPAEKVDLFYYRDQLGAIWVRFSPADFNRVADAMVKKHGPPGLDHRAVDQTMTWRSAGQTMQLDGRNGLLVMSTDAYAAEAETRGQRETAKNARDL